MERSALDRTRDDDTAAAGGPAQAQREAEPVVVREPQAERREGQQAPQLLGVDLEAAGELERAERPHRARRDRWQQQLDPLEHAERVEAAARALPAVCAPVDRHSGGTHHEGDRLVVLLAQRREQQRQSIRRKLQRLLNYELSHGKALTLQERIKRYRDCWLVFLDDPRVPPTNNHAERCLRPLVILRKITFGHRTHAGAQAMARIMTVKETAKRHGRKMLDVFYRMFTRPPDRVLRYIYGGPGMARS